MSVSHDNFLTNLREGRDVIDNWNPATSVPSMKMQQDVSVVDAKYVLYIYMSF
jgi:hypothetical protein